uniref:Uncharacterized protein n=1 Tax=viral metagenome TaxID=1070528 RepID=A0A6C0LRR2_9ZZZZ
MKLLYAQFLPYILPTSTMIGLYSAALEIDYMDKYRIPITDNKMLKTLFGNYAFGIIAGLTYPVSIPMIATHYMYSTYHKKCY